MIDVRSARESRPETHPDTNFGIDLNSNRAKSKLPYAATQGNIGGEEPYPNQGNVQIPPVREGRSRRDAFATRIGDDFDDLLEISPPVLARQRPETSPLLDERLYETNTSAWTEDETPPARPMVGNIGASVGNAGYAGQDWRPVDPNSPSTGFGGGSRAGGGSRETRDISDFPGMGEAPEGPADIMGWPVLTDNASAEDENEYEEISRRQGLLMRIVLGAAVFAGLIGGAYFFLGDLISKRQDQSESMQVAGQAGQPAPGTGVPGAAVGGAVAASVPPVSTELTPGDSSSGVGLPGSSGQSQPVDIPPMTGRTGHSEPTTPLLPEPLPTPVASPAPTTGNWTIQIASYSDKGQAGSRVAGLKSSNIPARLVTVEIPRKGTWYRVQIGGYDTREEGAKYGNQLRSRGVIQDFIVTGISK